MVSNQLTNQSKVLQKSIQLFIHPTHAVVKRDYLYNPKISNDFKKWINFHLYKGQFLFVTENVWVERLEICHTNNGTVLTLERRHDICLDIL